MPEEELGELRVTADGAPTGASLGSSVVLDTSEVPYMLDALMVLYHLGMASNFKAYSYQQQNQLQAVQQLEDAERRLQQAGTGTANESWVKHLKEAKLLFREDVTESVRHTTWYKVRLHPAPLRNSHCSIVQIYTPAFTGHLYHAK